MQSQDFALGGLPPAPCEWPKPHLPMSLHLLVTGEKEGADCFLSEGRSCLMDFCVLPVLCWVALAPHSQGPVATHLGEGNASGPAGEAEESRQPQAGPEPACTLGVSIGICLGTSKGKRARRL